MPTPAQLHQVWVEILNLPEMAPVYWEGTHMVPKRSWYPLVKVHSYQRCWCEGSFMVPYLLVTGRRSVAPLWWVAAKMLIEMEVRHTLQDLIFNVVQLEVAFAPIKGWTINTDVHGLLRQRPGISRVNDPSLNREGGYVHVQHLGWSPARHPLTSTLSNTVAVIPTIGYTPPPSHK